MTKDDLKTGMIVQSRNGTYWMVLKDTCDEVSITRSPHILRQFDITNNKFPPNKWTFFENFDNDLHNMYDRELDIVSVYKCDRNADVGSFDDYEQVCDSIPAFYNGLGMEEIYNIIQKVCQDDTYAAERVTAGTSGIGNLIIKEIKKYLTDEEDS